jgi:hypothetical protein
MTRTSQRKCCLTRTFVRGGIETLLIGVVASNCVIATWFLLG